MISILGALALKSVLGVMIAVLVPLAMGGLFPHALYTFAVLDPTLAIGAWIFLSRDSKF